MLLDTKLPFRYIIKDILPDTIRVLLISIVFQLLKQFYSNSLPQIPLQLPTVLGGSISLLLAFKISQSYDRWWEARKVWGAIVNDSRSLVVQVATFVPDEDADGLGSEGALKPLTYRQIAWCYSLGQTLRGQDGAANLAQYLSESELDYIMRHSNKPLALIALHARQIKELFQLKAINAFQQVQLDSTLVRLVDAQGRAERINSTVFPSSYRLLIYLFIYLFLGTLSLGLVETMGLWEIPLLLAIATTYFLLERTARYLQDPFSNRPTDTPVTAIARTVEINLKQLLEEQDVPAPAKADSYYLM
ncbi:bestrophin family protein [Hymenobacter sp. B1770]|uniref:bestrophin family protein n=1 Tax=Hymenobacter sp. B1770 TaxID=1718788 RepID=UPI003CF428ED